MTPVRMTMMRGALENVLKIIRGPEPYTGPIACWQDVIDSMTIEEAQGWLAMVKRSRRRSFAVNHNGRAWGVRRAELRDYLRSRPLARWMRQRPIPEGKSDTIKFRRYVPFRGPL